MELLWKVPCMKDFEMFAETDCVKKQPPDYNLANSLLDDSVKRMKYARLSKLTEENAKYIYENIYESLREAADAILAINGFKSFSHEATISFLQKFKEFSAEEISDFGRMRKKRNGMKYYGRYCSVEDAKEAAEVAEKLLKKVIEFARSLIVKQGINTGNNR